MPDWQDSMLQTFEFYEVDPETWGDRRKLDKVLSCSITRDLTEDTLGSASITTNEELDECYIRPYLITVQNNIRERFPLGVYLCQTPSVKYDGFVKSIELDAYTPLVELQEKLPPLGYSIIKGRNILDVAHNIMEENMRAPIIKGKSDATLTGNFVANTSDTWLTYILDLVSVAEHRLDIDEKGRIMFSPYQDIDSLQPVWTYTDDNSSILYPEITVSRDLYGIPNVVEVIFSTEGRTLYARAVNDDPNSPISTVSRGREIVHRDSNPELPVEPTQTSLNSYAKDLLRRLSSLEYELSYSHGYCPVRIGDCVMLDYVRADIRHVKARVIRQSIKCEPGMRVEETAVYTENLWR